MIDEPLMLLAEAFGQGPERPIAPLVGDEASDDPSEIAFIAAASAGQAETTARAH